jgi:hypothetical protein
VASDLEDKIRILSSWRQSDRGSHYQSIQSMIEHEVGLKFHLDGRMKSGSRTLLRLHRALEFIIEFIDRLGTSTDEDNTSTIASEVYYKTLARYHPWLVQKMADLAMYMLPSRRQLIQVMCKHDYNHVIQMLSDVTAAGRPVYDITQRLYTQYDLHSLP